jgi:hypothetical protein
MVGGGSGTWKPGGLGTVQLGKVTCGEGRCPAFLREARENGDQNGSTGDGTRIGAIVNRGGSDACHGREWEVGGG